MISLEWTHLNLVYSLDYHDHQARRQWRQGEEKTRPPASRKRTIMYWSLVPSTSTIHSVRLSIWIEFFYYGTTWYYIAKRLHFYIRRNLFSVIRKVLPFGKKLSWGTKNFLEFEAEGQEFAKFLRSLEQFIQTVKGQNNVW